MDSLWESSFLDQTVNYHASGGDLDALVDATPDGRNKFTRLYYAADKNWCSAIKWLLQQGANVNLGWPSLGRTPLHVAAARGHFDAAVLLLDAGVRVDCASEVTTRLTALHLAAGGNNSKTCKLLLSRGATLDARNFCGRDAEAAARLSGFTTLADLLAAVRAAGGWVPYIDAPRKELLALRQRLPALRERGRAAPSSSVRAHERLFLDTPDDDVFSHVLAFWRSDRDD